MKHQQSAASVINTCYQEFSFEKKVSLGHTVCHHRHEAHTWHLQVIWDTVCWFHAWYLTVSRATLLGSSTLEDTFDLIIIFKASQHLFICLGNMWHQHFFDFPSRLYIENLWQRCFMFWYYMHSRLNTQRCEQTLRKAEYHRAHSPPETGR